MITLLYDKGATALSLLGITRGAKKSALWVFFSVADEERLSEILAKFAPLCAWAIQNDVYLDPINSKIKDHKSAFGKLGMQGLVKNRIFGKQFMLDRQNCYFDFSKIDPPEFMQLMRRAKTQPIGFAAYAENMDPLKIYNLAIEERQAKKIILNDHTRLIYGDTLDGNSIVIICGADCFLENAVKNIDNNSLITRHDYISKYIKTPNGTLTPLFTTPN